MNLSLLLCIASGVAAKDVYDSSIESLQAQDVALSHINHCAMLGFDVNALDCRLCDDFLAFSTSRKPSKLKAVQLMSQECHDCCSDFSKILDAEGRRYAKAVLAISQYQLRRYPKVASFVEHQASGFKDLDIQDANARLPMLQFFDNVGSKMEEISVAYWDEQSIAEFLSNKLLSEKKEEEMMEDKSLEVEVKA